MTKLPQSSQKPIGIVNSILRTQGYILDGNTEVSIKPEPTPGGHFIVDTCHFYNPTATGTGRSVHTSWRLDELPRDPSGNRSGAVIGLYNQGLVRVLPVAGPIS
jgi:hypothetical protein